MCWWHSDKLHGDIASCLLAISDWASIRSSLLDLEHMDQLFLLLLFPGHFRVVGSQVRPDCGIKAHAFHDGRFRGKIFGLVQRSCWISDWNGPHFNDI